ncbi:MAG: hypothetical protein NXI27_24110 [Alphaproteobacteria bacterium]|nr:hypothetical protein [Alphaproteobacteria bacterium]
MGHRTTHLRRRVPLGIGLAVLTSVAFPGDLQASVDYESVPEMPSAASQRLALSDVGDVVPDNKPDGTLEIPEATGNTGAEPVSDDDPSSLDTLETDVTDDTDHSPAQAEVTVSYDLSVLPKPVVRMRELIVEAAAKGNIEGLRPLLGVGNNRTELSIGGYEGDPIDFLKEISGDGQGHELLAILLDIFQTGYAHLDAGEPTELYLWPYFYSVPLDSLDDRQMVELFRVITAGDYEDMQAFGSYIFYRTAISPDGEWKFFVAGD